MLVVGGRLVVHSIVLSLGFWFPVTLFGLNSSHFLFFVVLLFLQLFSKSAFDLLLLQLLALLLLFHALLL